MSLATVDTARTAHRTAPAVPSHLRAAPQPAPSIRRPHAAPASAVATAPAAPVGSISPAATRPARLRAVPEGTEARGFAIYVGLDEIKAAAAGTDLGTVVAALKRLASELAPGVETHAAVALAPEGAGGRDIDVVRLALQDPAAVAQHREQPEDEDRAAAGVVVDLSRKRVVLDNQVAALTYKEFELLQYLVLREGRTIDRSELISSLWSAGAEDIPNERTIDVHIRRLRSKLGGYEEIVRTVRGVGYRFDRHADVAVHHASSQSPDLF